MIRHAPRVLVVDDLPDAADTMATLLNLCGFDCESQYGGDAALASAKLRRPDLVLLDLCMHRMDGFEFVRRLREVDGCGCTPIVIISGVFIAESHARAQELGIVHYFSKPVGLRPLMKAMKELLDNPLTHVRFEAELVADGCDRLVAL